LAEIIRNRRDCGVNDDDVQLVNYELSAFVEAHDDAFSIQNIQSGFCGTGIMPFNPSKVIHRVKPPASTIEESIIIRDSISLDFTTSFKSSVLTNSPIYNEDTRSANAALLTELMIRDILSTHPNLCALCCQKRRAFCCQEYYHRRGS